MARRPNSVSLTVLYRPTVTMTQDELRKRIAAIEWYHTLELAPGVETPGWFDNRPALSTIPFPASLTGKRCLDCGTYDGFWAYEMERRGASEVLAIDIINPLEWDWPNDTTDEAVAAIGKMKSGGTGFELAREALGSEVQRRELSIYDLDPDDVGTFDFVYVGSLLLHLRDPVGALMKVRRVCTGEALFVDAVDLALTLSSPRRPAAHLDGRGRPWWWKPNLAGFARMVESAGFKVVVPPKRFYMKPGLGQPTKMPPAKKALTRYGREMAVTHLKGDPHAALLAHIN
jgi:tRNA (mo5U34)-methyltransferase